MFLMRRAKIEDVPTVLKLAKMVHFINLPADKDILAEKALWSRQCFLKVARALHKSTGTSSAGDGHAHFSEASMSADADGGSGLAAATQRSDLFMFILEDTESRGVLGTSQIIAQMGGPGHPNVSFELSRKEMFSRTLQIGATHTVAKLVLDESGPTEIGGLILQPSYRGHKARLGRFLSLVRFHFIGLYRDFFRERVLAELMAPITPDGRNTLWEYLGRRFINLTYIEADRFCQYSKEFITSLLPREEIYLTLLPPEARSVIAQVGPETVPARKMLEKLGFAYRNRIDPFDGGPSLEAATADISLVRETVRTTLGEPATSGELKQSGMVSTLDSDGEFRCINAPITFDSSGRVRLGREQYALLEAEPGASVGVTPWEPAPLPAPRPARPAAKPKPALVGAAAGEKIPRRSVKKT